MLKKQVHPQKQSLVLAVLKSTCRPQMAGWRGSSSCCLLCFLFIYRKPWEIFHLLCWDIFPALRQAEQVHLCSHSSTCWWPWEATEDWDWTCNSFRNSVVKCFCIGWEWGEISNQTAVCWMNSAALQSSHGYKWRLFAKVKWSPLTSQGQSSLWRCVAAIRQSPGRPWTCPHLSGTLRMQDPSCVDHLGKALHTEDRELL